MDTFCLATIASLIFLFLLSCSKSSKYEPRSLSPQIVLELPLVPFHLDLSLMIIPNDEVFLVDIYILRHLIAPNPIPALSRASIFLGSRRTSVQISGHYFETAHNSVLHYCQPKALKEMPDFRICAFGSLVSAFEAGDEFCDLWSSAFMATR